MRLLVCFVTMTTNSGILVPIYPKFYTKEREIKKEKENQIKRQSFSTNWKAIIKEGETGKAKSEHTHTQTHICSQLAPVCMFA